MLSVLKYRHRCATDHLAREAIHIVGNVKGRGWKPPSLLAYSVITGHLRVVLFKPLCGVRTTDISRTTRTCELNCNHMQRSIWSILEITECIYRRISVLNEFVQAVRYGVSPKIRVLQWIQCLVNYYNSGTLERPIYLSHLVNIRTLASIVIIL